MIVLDASVVVELLTNGALADSIRRDLSGRDESFIVPHFDRCRSDERDSKAICGATNTGGSQRSIPHGTCSAAGGALFAHAIDRPYLGTAAQLHRLRCYVHSVS